MSSKSAQAISGLSWRRSKSRTKELQRRSRRGSRQWSVPESLERRDLMAGDIAGVVFLDANANGINETAENGLAGWTVFADLNTDGKFNAGEPSTVTDVKGKYVLTGLAPVATTVYDIPPVGYMPTPGFSDHSTITVRDNRAVKVDFPNVTAAPTTGRIAGTVFEDANENGVSDSGEDGLTGWTVFLDTNADGTLTAGEPSTTADLEGAYSFPGLAPGNYTVYEIPQGGLAPIASGLFPLEGASDHRAVTVVAGSTARANFPNLVPPVGTIQGTVWNDDNGDGLRGAGESALADRTVFVDLNANGISDVGEPSRLTDASGNYSFTNIHTGTYTVRESLPEGWINSLGRSSQVTASVFQGSTPTVDFMNLQPRPGSVSGMIWNDTNANGLQEDSESPLAGWQVYLDVNRNTVLDIGEPTATTNIDGEYSFDSLDYDSYSVRSIIPAAWTATAPISGVASFLLLNGEARSNVNFGVRERIGTIQGRVWNDANGDRAVGSAEAGLSDVSLFLDINANGVADVDEPQAITDALGDYSFARIPSGTYRVVEQLPAGWIASEGTSPSATVTVVTGGIHSVSFFSLTPQSGSISGRVWSDVNSNAVQDAGELGQGGWTVYVDSNRNGSLDPTDLQTTTNAAGDYTIAEVPYGTTTIAQQLLTGYTATTPAARTSLLLNGENRSGVNFGVHEPTDYVISGIVYKDGNVNGIRDAGEVGISGVTVYLDTNNNGVMDPTEPSTISSVDLFYTPATNELGTYSFTHLPRGEYQVRELVPDFLSATPDAARQQLASVGPTSAADINFANVYRPNEIHGVVFDDTNQNHSRDPQEYGRPGVTVYIDLDRDDVDDVDEPRTVTGADGSYSFINLTPGAYIVREDAGSVAGPHTYPVNGGGTLWPAGTSHASVGAVTPSQITVALAGGETHRETVSLTLPGSGGLTNLVDVFLLFDDTGSFTGNSPIVRSAFPTIMTQLQTALPGIDLGFGVGRLEEYGSFAAEFAEGRPFILNQPIVAASTAGSAAAIQSALDRTAPGYGGDTPETDIEALYQLVTGRGFDGNNNGSVSDSGPAGLARTQLTPGASGDVPAFASFVADPANGILAPDGNIGGGGFRTGALPVVLLATDTGFAYQPKGETTVVGISGTSLPVSSLTQSSRPTTPFSSGAGLQETVTGLNALGALVIGLGTNPESILAPRSSLEALSILTGAVNRSVSTIANGTADPIALGDPLYFQISSGFGTTVADGIVNAIQNAATNVALDVTVRASDPSVLITNFTGTLAGIAAGGTATFDVEFTGDGRPHRFDLEFVRAGTSVVLGSIPVVLGTPVVGEGYSYDELEDGEIHNSSHFGNYVANTAPSFVGGSDVTVTEDAGAQTLTNWATAISPGGATEQAQSVGFIVTSDNPALFSVAPTITPTGDLQFTTAPNAQGSTTLSVVLRDNGGTGSGGIDTSLAQTFVINVTPVNDAPTAADDAYTVENPGELIVELPGLLANDTDVDGDSLTASLVSDPNHGTVTLHSDGSFHYVPQSGYNGLDSFTYAVSDGTSTSNAATVRLAITRTNQAPIAVGDTFSVGEDGVLHVPANGVLANDTDADGDGLAPTLVAGPSHGTLTLQADGSFDYTPAANYYGLDEFTYSVSDGVLTSAVATVSLDIIAVNDAPVAGNDTLGLAEDGSLNIAATTLLANDSDIDGDPLIITVVAAPVHGTLAENADHSWTYIPAPNYHGTDSLTYLANDGQADSNLATVTLNVASINDRPTATGEAYTATEDTALVIASPGVLNNDVDVDGDPLRAIRQTAPTHGSVTLNANGSFTYTPAANYNGPDSFTYVASDGVLSSAPVTVNISVAPVNDAPMAANNAYSTPQSTTLTVPARGVLANDSDPDGDAITAVLGTGPTNGTVVLNADGSFTYSPNPGYVGPDSFTYRAGDATLASALATVQLTVTPPVAKFFVADADRTSSFQYAADGTAVGNTALNRSNSKPRGIASNSDGSLQWVVDSGGTVFVYNNAGALLGQWQPQNVGKPEGVTVWGSDLWLVDSGQSRVFKFAGGANLRTGRVAATSSFALNSGNLNPTDLVTDGAHVWVTNDTLAADRVYRYSATGALEGSWNLSTTNPSPTGITLDPTNVNHLWVVDAGTDRIYQYDSGTARTTGAQEPSRVFALAAGDTNPQGIADPAPLRQAADAMFAEVDATPDAVSHHDRRAIGAAQVHSAHHASSSHAVDAAFGSWDVTDSAGLHRRRGRR